jgi:hypothetical protein
MPFALPIDIRVPDRSTASFGDFVRGCAISSDAFFDALVRNVEIENGIARITASRECKSLLE